MAGSKTQNSPAAFVVMVCTAASILSLVGCSKSNPLIGKWKLQPNAELACAGLEGIQFSDTTMTLNVPISQTVNVTYARNGDNWTVNGTPAGPITFQAESGGIKSVSPMECHLVPAN
jgi:hypothetical protein